MRRYHDFLIESLKNPEEAAEYLNAALAEGDRHLFLVALRNIAEAHGGMVRLSQKTKLSRPNLYRMLSQNGHPEIQSLCKVLEAFGLGLSIAAKKPPSKNLPKAA